MLEALGPLASLCKELKQENEIFEERRESLQCNGPDSQASSPSIRHTPASPQKSHSISSESELLAPTTLATRLSISLQICLLATKNHEVKGYFSPGAGVSA